MSSIKKNFAYSTILTISGYLFPLMTYPYVTRVLGVDNIGICNYIDSFINYGILFSMMGMGTVAIREIAQNKLSKDKLSSAFSNLLTLNLITSIIAASVILILAYNIPEFYQYKKLFIIGASKILFNSLLIEWLYKGLEEFKYITIRSIIIKILYVIAIFLFVKTEADYILYFAINAAMVMVNAIVNIIYSRHYLKFSIKNFCLSLYIKPFFVLGVYNILTSMYTSFNIMYLGLSCGTTEVGYYSTAVKFYTIIMSVFTAFTGVMMPRLSALYSEGKMSEFLRLSNKSVDLLLSSVIPLVVFVFSFADEIIYLIAGPGYEDAALPLKIIAPLLLIIGYEQVIIIQMLLPLKKDKVILINSIVGATIGITLNILIVPYLRSVGSAIVWISSEITVLSFAQHFISKEFPFSFPWKKLLERVALTIPLLIFIYLFKFVDMNFISGLLLGLFIIISYFLLVECIFYKNEYILLSTKNVFNIIRGIK